MGLLDNHTALVAGGSRGAGRGIAIALGEEGCRVIVTGRSREGRPSADGAPGTIEETARAVDEAGGTGVPLACDHGSPEAVREMVARITAEYGRIDHALCAVWGDNEGVGFSAGPSQDFFSRPFHEQPPERWERTIVSGVRSHLILATCLAPHMIKNGSGLLGVVSFNAGGKWLGDLHYDLAKSGMNRLAFNLAQELTPHGVCSVALSPGHMRTERVQAVLEDLTGTESPLYLGRACAALAGDPERIRWSGQALFVADLAREYHFTDEDGSQPPRFELP